MSPQDRRIHGIHNKLITVARARCWHCGQVAYMTLIGPVQRLCPDDAVDELQTACFQCGECHCLMIGTATIDGTEPHRSAAQEEQAPSLLDGRKIDWRPRRTDKAFPYVPEDIASAASEAHSVMAVDAHRAAAILARAVIEATSKNKGITAKSLIHRIDQMYERNLIRKHIKDAAHEIRLLANAAAHGDPVTPVIEAEAQEVLNLMDEVLEEVYQSQARVGFSISVFRELRAVLRPNTAPDPNAAPSP